MIDLFGVGLIKGQFKVEPIDIDNHVFKMHHKATFIVLLMASLLVTCTQYIGDPIDCIVEEIPNPVSLFM